MGLNGQSFDRFFFPSTELYKSKIRNYFCQTLCLSHTVSGDNSVSETNDANCQLCLLHMALLLLYWPILLVLVWNVCVVVGRFCSVGAVVHCQVGNGRPSGLRLAYRQTTDSKDVARISNLSWTDCKLKLAELPLPRPFPSFPTPLSIALN